MKNIEVKILLDKDDAIYKNGDKITGRVLIRVKEKLKINSIYVTLNGSGQVSLGDTTGKKFNRKTLNSFEEYLHSKKFLLENKDITELYLNVGDYVYNFKFLLPKILPSSFEHTFGFIRYVLIVTIDIPWAFDYNVKKLLSVIQMNDLNHKPHLTQSVSTNEIKRFGCCYTAGSITASLNIDKTGYVSGETINFNALITNNSNREIKSLMASVMQKLKLYARGKTKVFYRQLTEIINLNPILALKNGKWENGKLKIPSTVPTLTNLSQIIDISYVFILSVNIAGVKTNFDLLIPIEIGSVPLIECSLDSSTLILSHELCSFGAPGKNENLDPIDSGETLYLDLDFVPYYPFYLTAE